MKLDRIKRTPLWLDQPLLLPGLLPPVPGLLVVPALLGRLTGSTLDVGARVKLERYSRERWGKGTVLTLTRERQPATLRPDLVEGSHPLPPLSFVAVLRSRLAGRVWGLGT